MGNCLRKCFGQFDRRRQFLHTKYSVDKESSIELQEDEEELRREEEAYLEAKREAARIAKLQQQKEEAAKQNNGPKSWTAGQDGDWEVAGGDDDFEMFLESVRERSLKATAHLRKDSPDGQSSNSSSTPTPVNRERSHTEGSNSVELEWDHDEDTGIKPVSRERSKSEEDLMKLAQQEHRDSPSSPAMSADLEWDTEFIAAEDKDTQNLLTGEYQIVEGPR